MHGMFVFYVFFLAQNLKNYGKQIYSKKKKKCFETSKFILIANFYPGTIPHFQSNEFDYLLSIRLHHYFPHIFMKLISVFFYNQMKWNKVFTTYANYRKMGALPCRMCRTADISGAHNSTHSKENERIPNLFQSIESTMLTLIIEVLGIDKYIDKLE